MLTGTCDWNQSYASEINVVILFLLPLLELAQLESWLRGAHWLVVSDLVKVSTGAPSQIENFVHCRAIVHLSLPSSGLFLAAHQQPRVRQWNAKPAKAARPNSAITGVGAWISKDISRATNSIITDLPSTSAKGSDTVSFWLRAQSPSKSMRVLSRAACADDRPFSSEISDSASALRLFTGVTLPDSTFWVSGKFKVRSEVWAAELPWASLLKEGFVMGVAVDVGALGVPMLLTMLVEAGEGFANWEGLDLNEAGCGVTVLLATIGAAVRGIGGFAAGCWGVLIFGIAFGCSPELDCKDFWSWATCQQKSF